MSSFSKRVLHWFDQHGRKDLPWQQNISPYRVWVSEIMLQQTQVGTVIPYYQRFMKAFPTVARLAKADSDQVLYHWTGLGYYARARNLHATAKQVMSEFGGEFPDSVEMLETLPGIGRSTAGAIVAIAFGKRATILDGNVKRVLARHQAIVGWPGNSATLQQLWQIAEQHTPRQRVADYTQAIMDLGATLCTRSKPACALCPVQSDCLAYARNEQTHYPGKKPAKTLPVRQTQMLMVETPSGELLLEKRPDQGIWGGLWSFPELSPEDCPQTWCAQRFGDRGNCQVWSPLRHTFSHYHLDIQPVHIRLPRRPGEVREDQRQLWYNHHNAARVGLAAPVKKLLKSLESQTAAPDLP